MTCKVFLSSPSDVDAERDAFERVVARINHDHEGGEPFKLVRWEHEAYTASSTFQAQIEKPSECDLVVCIFWKRLGSDLPDAYAREDGSLPTGTEYEFEEALRGAERSPDKLPDVLVYRKTADVFFSEEHLEYERAQRDRFLAFWRRWFHNEKGHFIAGFQSFADTEAFESLAEAHLRRWLADRERAVTWTEGPPYRGLEPFDVEHAPIFFGRARETDRTRARLLANCLAGKRFLLLVGASGSGKSSLARAGLIPRLAAIGGLSDIAAHLRWAITSPARIRPSWSQGLAEALFAERALGDTLSQSVFATPESLASQLAAGGAGAVAPIAWALERAQAREELARPGTAALLVLIDQLEEIFSWPADEAAAFLDLLATLSMDGDAPVLVVATMRSDFQHRITDIPALERLVGKLELRGPEQTERMLEIALPSATDLHAMIAGPARAAGLTFEVSADRERDLLRIIEAEAKPTALPAVQFLLAELYERADHAMLTLAAYDELGGSGGVMATRGEEVLAGLGAAERDAFPRVARALVTRAAADAPATAAPVPEAAFGTDTPEARLVAALKASNLLMSDRGQVRLAHESLISGWARLGELIDRERRLFEARARLLPYLERYLDVAASSRKDRQARLLTGFPLEEARELLSAWGPEVLADSDPSLPGFIAASIKRETWRRRRGLAVGWAVAIVLAGLSGLMYELWTAAEESRTQAEAALDVVQSRNAVEKGDLRAGVRHGMHALERLPSARTRSAALAALLAISPHLESTLSAGGSVLAWLSPDALALAGGDGALHSIAAGAAGASETSVLVPGEAVPLDFAHRLDESTLLLVYRDGSLRRAVKDAGGRWQIAPGAHPSAVPPAGGAHAVAAGASAVGTAVAMADFEGARLRRCAPDGAPASCVDTVVGPPGATAVALSPDVRRLAVGYEGAVAVYDLEVAADGTAPKVSEAVVAGEVLSVAWSATGDRLAVGTREDRLLVLSYRAEAGRVVAERTDETSVRAPLLALAWSPAGHALAFPCEDDAICVRRPGAGGPTTVTHRLHGHRNTVSRLAWSPDGTRLASVDDDQEVRLWRMMPDTRVLSVLETDGLHVLRAVAVDRARGRVAAGDDAGRVWLWHGLDVWQAPRLLPAPPGVSAPAVAIEFAPDGALAVLHEDTGIAIRDPGGGAVERYEAIAGSFNRLAWIDGGRQIAVPLIPRRILLVPRAGAARVLPDPGIALDARSVAPLPAGDGFVANYTDGSIWPWSNDGTLGADALVTAADAGAGARGGMSLTFDPTGQRLSVSRDDDLVRVYDLSGASRPLDLPLPAPISVGVAFGPRGPDLAVLGGDAQLHLWTVDEKGATARFSVAAPAHVRRLAQHRGVSSRPVTALAWWDETHLLLASAAGNLLVLDLDEAHWHERAASLGLAAP